MYRCAKIRITDLNPHLMCVLCGGYFIDATTVIECLHSFCRTCIVRYLESSKFCPICDVQVHKTRPLLNIRADKTLQDLVYKLVPGLFEEEMRRRREFLLQHPEVKVKHLSLEERGLAQLMTAHTLPEENISLVLELAPNGHPALCDKRKRKSARNKAADRRYLLCPADVSIGHLKKFIRLKFNLPDNYQIDMFHLKSQEAITDDFTLLDITFVFSWNRKPRFDEDIMKPTSISISATTATTDSVSRSSSGVPLLLPAVASSASRNVGTGSHVTDVQDRPPKRENGPKNKSVNADNKGRTNAKNEDSTAEIKTGTSGKPADFKVKADSKDSVKNSMLATLKAEMSGHSSRSNSPKGGSRTASPKPTTNGGNSRTSSPKLTNGRAVATSITKPINGTNSRTASPKPTNGRSSGTSSPKPASGRNGRTASPKLPAERCNTNRTASPKLSAEHCGRTASPKLSVERSSRTASPKLSAERSSRTASPKLISGRSSRTSSPKPTNGRTNGTSNPKLTNGRPTVSGPTVALVPVEQSITVDVNVGTVTSSSSEASPGVTSPGAEDRANSAAIADLPDNLNVGTHVCNIAAFAPRPLPELNPACLAQGHVKGVSTAQSQGRGGKAQPQGRNNSRVSKIATSRQALKILPGSKAK
ncbi:hypothetical protein BaRGS_00028858, partial [Batillaria attramentaria]